MSSYLFSTLTDGQTLVFDPALDTLSIDVADAGTLTQSGPDLLLTYQGKNIRLAGLELVQLSPDSISIADGGQLLLEDGAAFGGPDFNVSVDDAGTASDGVGGTDIPVVETVDADGDTGLPAPTIDTSGGTVEDDGEMTPDGSAEGAVAETPGADDGIPLLPSPADDALGGSAEDGGDLNDGIVILNKDILWTETPVYLAYGNSVGTTRDIVFSLKGPVASIDGDGSDNALVGTVGDDKLNGLVGDDTLFGGVGKDWLDGGAGADILIGGAGNDTYVVDVVADIVRENRGEGVDTVLSSLPTTLLGANLENLRLMGAGNLNGVGNSLDNRLYANSGNNVLDGGQGIDTVSYQYGSKAGVTANLREAKGGSGVDVLLNIENLTGSRFDDRLSGDWRSNRLDGGLGADRLAGDDGDDTYIIDNTGDRVLENADEGSDTVLSSLPTYRLSNYVENLRLTGVGDINGIGNAEDNKLTGNDGRNTLEGGNGDDSLFGGIGDDKLLGGSGDDRLSGGRDADTLTGDAGNDELEGGIGDDRLAGGSGNDSLVGGAGDDTLAGGEDNDTLDGGSGNDALAGNLGNDSLDGGAGDDTLAGNAGNDSLDGGGGKDTLMGGDGNDRLIVYDLNFTSVDGGNGTDTLILNPSPWSLWDHAISGWKFRTLKPIDPLAISGADFVSMDGSEAIDSLMFASRGLILDLAVSGSKLHDIETIDLDSGNTLKLTAATLSKLSSTSDKLVVNAIDYSSAVDAGQGWLQNADVTANGHIYHTYSQDAVSLWVEATATTLINGTLQWGSGDLGRTLPGRYDGSVTIVTRPLVFTGGSAIGIVLIPSHDPGVDTAGDSQANTLVGGDGIDRISGLGGNDTLFGSAGNDKLDGGAGVDTLIGGADDDLYVVDNAGDIVWESAYEGRDTVQSYLPSYLLDDNVENLRLMGKGNLNGVGNSLDNQLYANTGNNVLDGGSGIDTASYQYGATAGVTVNLDEHGIQATAGSGADALLNIENLTGSPFNDSLTGTAGNNVLNGGLGADSLTGGAGNDAYVIDNTGDTVTEVSGQGDDTVLSSLPTYRLVNAVENLRLTGTDNINGTGNGSNNSLIGNSGNNTLDGGGGDDRLDGGSGSDTLIGGAGDDIYVVDDSGDVVRENRGEGSDTALSSLPVYALENNVENLRLTGSDNINGIGNTLDNKISGNSGDNQLNGGAGADQLDGKAGDDILLGNEGSDNLSGGTGDDTLIGGTGDDWLDGGADVDSLVGGKGNDSYVVDDARDKVVESADAGADTVKSSLPTYTLGDNVENLSLTGKGNHSGTGNALNNELVGNSGNNLLIGKAGDDSLVGGGGRDTLLGDEGNDRLVVSDLNFKRVDGGKGTDTLALSPSSGGLALDLAVSGAKLHGLETIDLGSGNSLKLTAATLLELSDTTDKLLVNASDNSSFVDAGLGWTHGADASASGHSYHTYTQGAATLWVEATATVNINGSGASSVTNTTGGGAGGVTIITVEILVPINHGVAMDGDATDNTLVGTDGNDTFKGLAGNDSLFGGAGDDVLHGGTGIDLLVGDAGDDTYVVDNFGDKVAENPGEGRDTVLSSLPATLLGENIENLRLTGTGNLNGIGNALDNLLYGNLGNNVLDGGQGIDTVSYQSGATSAITVSLASTTRQITGGSGTDVLFNFENLTGSAFNDSLTGNDGKNVLNGGLGDDTLIGAGGKDWLRGGAGDDLIRVSDLSFQKVDGGDGFDTLALDQGGLTLNLAAFHNRLTSIERIDTGASNVILSKQAVLDLVGGGDSLQVEGSGGYTLAGTGWVQGPDAVGLLGVTYHSFDNGLAHVLIGTGLTAL